MCVPGSGHPVRAGVRPRDRTRRVPSDPADRAPVIGRSKAAHGRPFSNRTDTSTGDRVTGRGRRTLGTSTRRRRANRNYYRTSITRAGSTSSSSSSGII